ncbi:MAG: GNAT family N-acetyltransferase [Paracoccaceae bacterium]
MIRDATGGDAAAIATIWNHYIRDTAVTFNAAEKPVAEVVELIAARQAAGRAFLVAEADGRVQGFATYDQFRGGIGYAHAMEHTIHLAPDARSRGIGARLMYRVEMQAKAAGAHVVVAGVSAENSAGLGFHAAMGYVQVGMMPEVGYKFGRSMNLVLMQKILS